MSTTRRSGPDSAQVQSPPRFARSGQMVECLRSEWLYSEKRPRDLLFSAVGQLIEERPPMMVSQLAREAACVASERATAAGQAFDNVEVVTKAVMKTLLMAGALRDQDGEPIPFDIAAQAAIVGSLSDDFEDRAEAFLLEVIIHRLGNVTTSDHRALAHALFRQFDARVALAALEDRVAVLLARLRDRVDLFGDAYAARAVGAV